MWRHGSRGRRLREPPPRSPMTRPWGRSKSRWNGDATRLQLEHSPCIHSDTPERKVHINRSPHSLALLVIAYLGFISLGLPDTLIGVAWPSVRATFELSQGAVSVVFFGVGFSYFVS